MLIFKNCESLWKGKRKCGTDVIPFAFDALSTWTQVLNSHHFKANLNKRSKHKIVALQECDIPTPIIVLNSHHFKTNLNKQNKYRSVAITGWSKYRIVTLQECAKCNSDAVLKSHHFKKNLNSKVPEVNSKFPEVKRTSEQQGSRGEQQVSRGETNKRTILEFTKWREYSNIKFPRVKRNFQ